MRLQSIRRVGAPIALVSLLAFWNALLHTSYVSAQEGEVGEMVELPASTPSQAEYSSRGLDALAQHVGESQVGEPSGTSASSISDVDRTLASLPSGASSISPQATSLPSGAATQLGMGESFTTQLSTGGFTYDVPISLPSARGLVQPKLDLAYNSSGGFGVAGLGWSIGSSAIGRQSDRGLPSYDDRASWHPNQDKFVFGGTELVPICTVVGGACAGALVGEVMPAWADGYQYFRSRVEGAFLRFFWSPDHRTWRVQGKDGSNMEFGAALDGTGYSALEANPEDPREINRWYLVRQYDSQGGANAVPNPSPVNVIVYRYLSDGAVLYLSDIFDTSPAATPTSTNTATYAHHTHIEYEARPDVMTSYRTGWRTDHGLRVSRIDVSSKSFAGTISSPREMVRRYHLSYDETAHRSLLTSVQLEGRCPQTVSENANQLIAETSCPRLPGMRFEYQNVQTNAEPLTDRLGRRFDAFYEQMESMGTSPPHSLDEAHTELADVNADGLPDVLVTAGGLFNGRHGVYFNGLDRSGAYGFRRLRTLAVHGAADAPDSAVLNLANRNVAALDLDSDGVLNLVHMPMARRYSVFAPVQQSTDPYDFAWMGHAVPTASAQDTKIDFTSDASDIRVMDVNGDGLVDIVHSSPTEVQTFFSLGRFPDGDDQFGQAVATAWDTADISNDPVTACAPWSATPVRFSDPDTHIADMNGDGLADLVRVRSGRILYWPGRGNGFWGTGSRSDCHPGSFGVDRHIEIENAPHFGRVNPGTLLLSDVSGDGLADMVEVRHQGVDIYLNDNGDSFTDRHVIFDTPFRPSDGNYVRLADINGSGTPDILWGAAHAYQYIDLTGGVRPGLLSRVHNGLGRTLDLEYQSSADHMLDAEAANQPWSTRGPISVPLLVRATVRDNLDAIGRPAGIYASTFEYRDPAFEGRQREFRGFRQAIVTTPGNASSPTTHARTIFQLGECPTAYNGTTADVCSAYDRWQDNWREALKGLPVVSETFDDNGVYLSTEHSTYELRQLYTGLDGRRVVAPLPTGKDGFLYDTQLFDGQVTSQQLSEVTLNLSGVAVAETRPVTLRATAGRAQVRSTTEYDNFGNVVRSNRHGCVAGCPNGIDEVITTHSDFARPSGDASGWLFREQRGWVTGSVQTAARGETTHTYNARGQVLQSYATLSGTLVLDRFHATAGTTIAPAPTGQSGGVSAPVQVLLADNTYDSFGHVVSTKESNNICTGGDFDILYAHLPVTSRVYGGVLNGTTGCGSRVFTSSVTYDRGLEAVVTNIDVTNQPARYDYDGFGRLAAVYGPNPSNPGQLAAYPSMQAQYILPMNADEEPFSTTIVRAQNGLDPNTNSYVEAWSFSDGLGRTIASLQPGDVSAGDLGNWIVSGETAYGAKGEPVRAYDPHFYNGAPEAFSLAIQAQATLENASVSCWPGTQAPSGTSQCSFRAVEYDAFGRKRYAYGRDGVVAASVAYHALSTDLYDRADLVDPQRQGTHTSVVSDGHGRGVERIVRVHAGATIELHRTKNEYLPTGEVQRVVQSRSGSPDHVRWMKYDTMGRMVLNAEPNTSVGFNADPNTNPSTIKAYRYAYNDSGAVVGVSDARGCGANYFYDTAGRLVAEDRSPCATGQVAYTAPNLTNGNGTEAFYRYDVADPDGASIVDAAGVPFTISTPLLWGRLSSVSSLGSKGVYRYDALGRATGGALRVQRPGNAASSLSTRYATRWYVSTQTLDAMSRPLVIRTGVTVPELLGTDGTSEIRLTYTARGGVRQINSSYGVLFAGSVLAADGAVLTSTLGDAANTRRDTSYDTQRRPQSVQTYRGNGVPFWSNPSGTLYTPPLATDDPTQQLLLEDRFVEYDDAGNITRIEDNRIDSDWPGVAKPVTRDFEYDDLNRLTRTTYTYSGGNAWQSPYSAENSDASRVQPSPHVSFVGRLTEQTHQYDWLGNISRTTDDQHGFWDRSLGDRAHGTANLGPHQILSSSNRVLAPSSTRKGDLSASYDAAGNLTNLIVRRDGTCLPTGAQCWQRFHYVWDEVGQLMRARRWDLTVPERTSAGQLAQALPSRAANADLTYFYDGSGGRVLKTALVGGVTKHTVYALPGMELRSTTYGTDYVMNATSTWVTLPAGIAAARLVYGPSGLPLVYSSTGQQHIFFELTDHLGSSNITIDRATGELVELTTYQSYGATESDYRTNRWASFREPNKFSGKEEDIEVGLQYFGARYYSPYLGTWMSPDPVTIHDLGSDANPYSYVAGRPLTSVDPDGREPVSIGIGTAILVGMAIGAIVGGAVSIGVQLANNGGRLDKINLGLKGVAGAIIMGAVAGGVSAGVGGVVGGALGGATTSSFVVGGAAGGLAGAGTSYAVGIALGNYRFSWEGLGSSLIGGAVGGAVGGLDAGGIAGSLGGGVAGSTTSYFSGAAFTGAPVSAEQFAISMGAGVAGAVAGYGLSAGATSLLAGGHGQVEASAPPAQDPIQSALAGGDGDPQDILGTPGSAEVANRGSRRFRVGAVGGVPRRPFVAPWGRGHQLTGHRGFNSHRAFVRAFGRAGPNRDWHHIVEQTPANLQKFGSHMINNTRNYTNISRPDHQLINALYSSINPRITGSSTLTVRQWLAPQSFEAQQAFGIQVMFRMGIGLQPPIVTPAPPPMVVP